MAPSLTDRLPGAPRKPLASEALRGEGLRNFLADAAHRALCGRVIELTLKHSKLQPKEAALLMGYEDGGASLSRWISTAEPPCFWRVLRVPAMRRGLLLALAELDEAAQLDAVIRIPIARLA